LNKSEKALIRQMTILNRLNTGATLNVKELAEEFGVTERAIQKDFNERFKKLYPIQNLGEGYYRFEPSFRFQGTKNEMEQIAVSMMLTLQHGAVPQLSKEIDAALPRIKRYEKMFHFDIRLAPIRDLETFKVLLQNIAWRNAIIFDYEDKEGQTRKDLTVQPYRIANLRKRWYLIAYDLVDEKIKTYRLERIRRLRMTGDCYVEDPGLYEEIEAVCRSITTAWYDGNPKVCRLLLTGDAKTYLGSNPPLDCAVVEESEESLIMEMVYYQDLQPLALAKKWLPDIEILDKRLQTKLEETLKGYLAR